MLTFWILLALFIILLFLIEVMTFVHELGHFMVAKFNKATVVEFAIGFGPVIYQKRIGDTAYSLRALPFGGYVSVLSDEIVQGIEKLKDMQLTPQQAVSLKKQLKGFDQNINWAEKPTIDKVSSPRKVWFACMGVTMNFFMLWAVLFVTYASAGKKEDSNTMYITPYHSTIKFEDNSTPNEPDTLLSGRPMISLPNHTETEKNNDPIVLKSQTKETQQATGEIYYEEIFNQVRILVNKEETIPGVAIIPLTNETNDSNLELTYNEPDPIVDNNWTSSSSAQDGNGGTWEGDYTFDYLVKIPFTKKIDKIYLISSDSAHIYIDPSAQTFDPLLKKPDFDKLKKPIVGVLSVEVAQITNDQTISYYPSTFGIVDDYMDVGFGTSIYLSLWDSIKYLGKGFVMLFDLITFGLVIEPGTPHLYANNYYIYNAANNNLWWGNMTMAMLVWMSYLMIVFNILPFPPLDGWHAFEYAYEGIAKKQISQKTTSLVFKIGIGLFFLVLIGGILFPILFPMLF